MNDCGEGGDGRAAPTCVEAILALTKDSSAHASLIVLGIDGTPSAPKIWMLYVASPDSVVEFKRLGEWAAFLRRMPRPLGTR
jgi:hypothetical protein